MKKTLWPVILIIMGVMLLFNAILPFRLPIFQVLLALFCVWIGVMMFTSSESKSEGGEESGEEEEERPQGTRATGIYTTENKKHKREYNCVFSSSQIDLTSENDLPEKIEINSVFSSTIIRLPIDYNVSVSASGAFCSMNLPNGQNIMLGDNSYRYGSQDPNAPTLNVKLNCVFGSLKCIVG